MFRKFENFKKDVYIANEKTASLKDKFKALQETEKLAASVISSSQVWCATKYYFHMAFTRK